MTIYIDADGCPVVGLTLRLAQKHGVEAVILCDTAHEIFRPGVRTITVGKGADSVDFALVNLLHAGDLAVTQDYGLAAMCLARGGVALRQDGLKYTPENIDALLLQRHTARKIRREGGRLRGPRKRTHGEDEAFARALEACLVRIGEKAGHID